MDLKSLFTSDEEMEELEDRDVTTCIVGFIDSVSAPAPSKKKNKDILFKFSVSNGSQRIFILIWDTALIEKFVKDIYCNRVININGGHCHAISRSRYNEENKIVPFEIIIKENTAISFMGDYTKTTKTNELQTVNFDTIQNYEGLIEICGYIKTPFALIHNRSGLTTYGLGAITDGKKKITIQIKNFVKCELALGDYVIVKGTVKGEGSLVIIYCNTINDITLDSEIETLFQENLLRGSRPVKRTNKKQ